MEDARIQVIVRKRPISQREVLRGDIDILSQRSPHTLVIKEERVKIDLTKYTEEHQFTFDRVYDGGGSNAELYKECVQPLVQAAFEGAKITCFAYGQTGSGKTYTMIGEGNTPGLYLLAADDLFKLRREVYPRTCIYVAFYEIYCNKLHDLLNNRNQLFVREDARQNVNIVGLYRQQVDTVDALMSVIQYGLGSRTTGQTGANEDSSRSHGILEITLREGKGLQGKMSFIDLAGSERGADVNSSDSKTRLDGAEINKSLLALKECIRALDQDKKHTPFRGSKLTQVLKNSFVGNCRTVMIANVSPCLSSCEHTLNSLRYADRVKELRRGKANTNNIMMLPRRGPNTVKYNLENERPESPIRPPEPYLLPLSQSASSSIVVKTRKVTVQRKSMERIGQDHEELIGIILEEEEDLICSHKKMIDTFVDSIKVQMNMLSEVDRPGSDIEQYTDKLTVLLDMKEGLIRNIKGKVKNFRLHLRTEEGMRVKEEPDIDVFDLDLHDDELL